MGKPELSGLPTLADLLRAIETMTLGVPPSWVEDLMLREVRVVGPDGSRWRLSRLHWNSGTRSYDLTITPADDRETAHGPVPPPPGDRHA